MIVVIIKKKYDFRTERPSWKREVPGKSPAPPLWSYHWPYALVGGSTTPLWKNKKDILFKHIAKQSSINIRRSLSVRGASAIFRKYMSNMDLKVHSMWAVVGVRNYVLFKNKKHGPGEKKRGKMKFYTLFTLRMYEIPSITVVLFIRTVSNSHFIYEKIRRNHTPTIRGVSAGKHTINL